MIKEELLKDIKESIKSYDGLELIDENTSPKVRGRWDVKFNGELFETYDIDIIFDNDYPKSLPKVYEISNKISHEEDMHFNPPDWHACLFVSHQRWQVWPEGTSFSKFLEIPVHNFFLGQAHFKAWGFWPKNRERSHGNQGIIEYYQELFNIDDYHLILRFLSEGPKKTIPRRQACPCGKKNRKYKNCHEKIVVNLRKNQSNKFLAEAIAIFRDKCK